MVTTKSENVTNILLKDFICKVQKTKRFARFLSNYLAHTALFNLLLLDKGLISNFKTLPVLLQSSSTDK